MLAIAFVSGNERFRFSSSFESSLRFVLTFTCVFAFETNWIGENEMCTIVCYIRENITSEVYG